MKKKVIALIMISFACKLSYLQGDDTLSSVVYKNDVIRGKMIDTHFYDGDSNYHAIIHAYDGNVYYVINTHNPKSTAQFFKYNPKIGKAKCIARLNEVVSEDIDRSYSQGKVHVDLYEFDKKIYFGTHAGAYKRGGSKELGLNPFPGGHFMSYSLETGKFEDFGIPIAEDGILSMNMDKDRKRMYAITWPSWGFAYFDLDSEKTKVWAKAVAAPGIEAQNFRYVQGPRSIGIDPRTGNVYWHNLDDSIGCYHYEKDIITTLEKPRLGAPILNVPLPGLHKPNWRNIRWSNSMQRFYGNINYTDYLFAFEPETGEFELMDRICAGPAKKAGRTPYCTLAFEFSEDEETIYYIAMNEIIPPDIDENEVNAGIKRWYSDELAVTEELHLITYYIPLRRYTDHGIIELKDGRRPRYCQGLEVGKDSNLYIVCWIDIEDKESEKGKKLAQARFAARPDEDQDKPVYEVNLVVVENPLKN
jgi:hypothetical protein